MFNRAHTLSNTALLLIAGHETTINLICNGTKSFMENRDQWDLFKQDTEGQMVRGLRGSPALRFAGQDAAAPGQRGRGASRQAD